MMVELAKLKRGEFEERYQNIKVKKLFGVTKCCVAFLNFHVWIFIFPEVHLEHLKILKLRHTLTLGPIVRLSDHHLLV